MFIAQFSITNFLFYILQDRIGVANLPSGNAQIAASALNSLRTAATVMAVIVGFALANRTERRKVFAQGYALLMAAAMVIPVLSPTWIGMLAFGILGGVAMGLYSAIDLTLMSRLLPNRDSAGRDLALNGFRSARAVGGGQMLAGQVRKRRGREVATDDFETRRRGLQALDDGCGNLAADRVGAQHAGVDMEQFHGCDLWYRFVT